MDYDLSLSGLYLPGLSGYTNEFGTKADKGHLPTTEQEADNRMMIYRFQRAIDVSEDSTLSNIEADRKVNITKSGVTVTLGKATYSGCELRFHNESSGASYVKYDTSSGTITKTLNANQDVTFASDSSLFFSPRGYELLTILACGRSSTYRAESGVSTGTSAFTLAGTRHILNSKTTTEEKGTGSGTANGADIWGTGYYTFHTVVVIDNATLEIKESRWFNTWGCGTDGNYNQEIALLSRQRCAEFFNSIEEGNTVLVLGQDCPVVSYDMRSAFESIGGWSEGSWSTSANDTDCDTTYQNITNYNGTSVNTWNFRRPHIVLGQKGFAANTGFETFGYLRNQSTPIHVTVPLFYGQGYVNAALD